MQHAVGNRLIHRWIEFGRLLRRNGVLTTAAQMRDLLQILGEPQWDWADRQTVYYVARALLCARHEDWPRFDLIFRQFWGRTRQIIIPSDSTTPRPETQTEPQAQRLGGQASDPGLPPLLADRWTAIDSPDPPGNPIEDAPRPDQVLLYSAYEQLRNRDFAEFSDEEVARARPLLALWRWQPGERRTRRLAPARRGRRLHVGPTLRRAMRTG